MKVSFLKPDITELEIAEVANTLRSGWIISGKKTKKFEESIASYCGTPSAVCVHSFTEGIERVLRFLGIGQGDEVITSAYMHVASAFAIERVGARIVMVDTAKDAYTISHEQLAGAITARTKAAILSDVGGVLCDYDKIRQVIHEKRDVFRVENEQQAALNRIALIGDAAHSFASTYNNSRSGQCADFTCFSFHSIGSLSAGEGGAVVWREFTGLPYSRLNHQEKNADTDEMLRPDADGQLSDVTASVLLAQLSRIDSLMKRRLEIIRMYDASLTPVWVQSLRHESDSYVSNGHLYMARIPSMDEASRDQLVQSMAECGVETRVHFIPLPMQTRFQKMGYSIQAFPNAYQQYANEISLPVYDMLTDEAVGYVADSLKKCIRRSGHMRGKHK